MTLFIRFRPRNTDIGDDSFQKSSFAQVCAPRLCAPCSANPEHLGDGPQWVGQASWASWMSSNGKRERRCRESMLPGLKDFGTL